MPIFISDFIYVECKKILIYMNNKCEHRSMEAIESARNLIEKEEGTDRLTDRQTDRQRYRQIDRQTKIEGDYSFKY